MTLLNVCGLSHHYAHGGFSGKHQHQAVLNNVSLTLKSGETVALLGRSGCGKSTLARLLVGLESPSQGNISWRGEPLAKLNRAQRKAFRRDIQMVFQDSISAVNPRKTVREINWKRSENSVLLMVCTGLMGTLRLFVRNVLRMSIKKYICSPVKECTRVWGRR